MKKEAPIFAKSFFGVKQYIFYLSTLINLLLWEQKQEFRG